MVPSLPCSRQPRVREVQGRARPGRGRAAHDHRPLAGPVRPARERPEGAGRDRPITSTTRASASSSLNSNEGQEKQADWLHEVLGQNPNRWTIVCFHHPIYSSAKGRDNAAIRKLWQPIFDEYHVDLVLQGHDHTYARTGLQTTAKEESGGSTPDPKAGTVYVNSVSGPKQYQLDRKPVQKRTAEGTQLYQVISVEGRHAPPRGTHRPGRAVRRLRAEEAARPGQRADREGPGHPGTAPGRAGREGRDAQGEDEESRRRRPLT